MDDWEAETMRRNAESLAYAAAKHASKRTKRGSIDWYLLANEFIQKRWRTYLESTKAHYKTGAQKHASELLEVIVNDGFEE